MTIFQIVQKPQLRGAEIFAAQLSNHLEDLGHKVVLITLYEGKNKLPFKGETLNFNRPSNKRFIDVVGWKMLSVLIDEYKPDIIQCNASDTVKFAVFSKLVNGWKVPIVARNANMIGLFINSIPSKLYNNILYRNVDSVVSVSDNCKIDINNLYPYTKDISSVVTNGVEIPQINHVEWKDNVKADKHLVHIAGYNPEKNHKGLIEIFKELVERNKTTTFHIHLLGDGPLRHDIEQRVEESGLSDYVSFYGSVYNPLDYIAKADAMVLPSTIEGLPGVILESFASETIVVANDVGGISEVVKEDTGYLVKPNDNHAFVTSIEKALFDDNSQKIANAKELIQNHFDNKKLAKDFEEVYLSL